MESEAGLGLPACHYWYVLHAEAAFGQTVFLWSATINTWQEEDGGISPFDSGGLWHGFVVTQPPLPAGPDRKMLFVRYDRALPGWYENFRLHLAACYVNAAEYIRGEAPRGGVPEIIAGPPNTSRAWAWEARICRDTPLAARLTLERAYWTADDRASFDRWLEDHDALDDAQLERIQSWCLTHSRLTENNESPASAATADLIARFGDS